LQLNWASLAPLYGQERKNCADADDPLLIETDGTSEIGIVGIVRA
jgi:hypothetical protein